MALVSIAWPKLSATPFAFDGPCGSWPVPMNVLTVGKPMVQIESIERYDLASYAPHLTVQSALGAILERVDLETDSQTM